MDQILAGLITYGLPVLGVMVFINAAGVPIPSTFFLLAAGAFVRQGMFSFPIAMGLGILAAVTGDGLSYLMGRLGKGWVERRFGQSANWEKAVALFDQHGGVAIWLSRFLLTPLAIPVNLVAGGSGYSYWRFLLYDFTGELVWVSLYIGLGYIFWSQWERLNQTINQFSSILIVVCLATGLGYALLRNSRKKMRSSASVV